MSAETPKQDNAEEEKRKPGRPSENRVRWVGYVLPETAEKLTAIMEAEGCRPGPAIDILAKV